MWLHNGLRWDEIYFYLLQMQCGFYQVPSVIFFLFYHFRPSHHLYLFIYFISGFIVRASVCQNRKQETVINVSICGKFSFFLIGRVGRWKSCRKVLVCVSHSSLQFPHSCSSLWSGVAAARPARPSPVPACCCYTITKFFMLWCCLAAAVHGVLPLRISSL